MTAPAETPVETTREWTDEEAEEVRRWSDAGLIVTDPDGAELTVSRRSGMEWRLVVDEGAGRRASILLTDAALAEIARVAA